MAFKYKIKKELCNEEETIIHASGRTDAKVHAVHQVFHFDTKKELPAHQWKRAINHFMPNDIYVVDACYVDEDATFYITW